MIGVNGALSGFDWDAGNRAKCERHGVTIAEIESVFARAFAVFPDPGHSRAETRFKAIGTSEAGRHVFVVFALRRRGSETFVRPISARFMHKKEVDHYEKQAAASKKTPGTTE